MLGRHIPSSDILSSRLGCHLPSSDTLSSSWVVRLSKRYVGLSPPFKWHVTFELSRPSFKETRWVVTSFKVACYVQIRRLPFKRHVRLSHPFK
ncbi:hypothetical protein KY290_025968 [Solanum tuberosum]|uniref:Uncharacterized protein n=1 Tax=Solanum tuberosum TaxID=4113 RepID=A0ABQ7UW87_SOLTU|nr:hypothetical protein KY289_025045 [Solanum tuberosum]KAH0755698.1 hypothetical protein KY290_025968 [Solanum tuberosum]